MQALLALLTSCGPSDHSEASPCAERSFYADADGDSHGDPTTTTDACSAPSGFSAEGDDCNDADASIHPGAVEICNAVDDDCDDAIDDGLETFDWYIDGDHDGYGGDLVATRCAAPPGTASLGGDCDDRDDAAHPGADEVCNDLDDDCDGLVDALDPDLLDGSLWYTDLDVDGYGDPTVATTACEQPWGAVSNADDCDDADVAVHPNADEQCNGIDDDCDSLVDDDDAPVEGQTIFYADTDGDTYGDSAAAMAACMLPKGFTDNLDDCNDGDDTVGPALDYWTDLDGDGYGSGPSFATCTPAATDVRLNGDCRATNANIHPGAEEICNDVDDNCDDLVDADDPLLSALLYGDGDGDGFGDDADTIASCDPVDGYVASAGDCDDDDGRVRPGAPEYCEGIDNDCDGAIDESVVYADWYPDDDGDGFGDAGAAKNDCAPSSGYVDVSGDCDDGEAATHPDALEVCRNDTDDDCDANTDNCAVPIRGADLVVHGTPDLLIGDNLALADVDADGTVDLVLGSEWVDDMRGEAFVIRGPTTGTLRIDSALTLSTTAPRARFGGGLGGGDVNGDTVDDLAIAAVGELADTVYLFLGPVTADADATEADVELAGPTDGLTGFELDMVPDMDGDGMAEVAIGVPNAGTFTRGTVYVASGACSGSVTLSSDATYAYEGVARAGELGRSSTAFGDANGDGLGDLAIGASTGGANDSGAVFLIEGGAVPGSYDVDDAAFATIDASADDVSFTWRIDAADYDGDGTTDLFVSAVAWMDFQGIVYVFLGPLSAAASTKDATVRWPGFEEWDAMGSALALGDVDGDKETDVLMGSLWGGPTGTGTAYLQLGLASGVVDPRTLVSFPAEAEANLGASAALVPDWMGDGGAEVMIGAPEDENPSGDTVGSVYVFFSDGLF
jgi:hypothetical protein